VGAGEFVYLQSRSSPKTTADAEVGEPSEDCIVIDLETLATNPERVGELSRPELGALIARVKSLEGAALAALLSDAVTDRALNADEIAARLGVQRRQLFRLVKAGRLSFVRRVSKNALCASERDVTRWLRSRGRA
jgi:hypothetical protein